ncbi:MAG: hypothetical protein IJN38_00275 [Clostridia bacterium]|nr:hypothetical protein [Clostridia bacterium]
MKKKFKAIISVLMSLVLIFSITSSAFATEAEGCDCGQAPTVFVPGIGAVISSVDENGEEYSVFPIENSKLIPGVIGFLPVALITGVFGGWEYVAKALDTLLNDLFADMYCDNKGNPVKETFVNDSHEVTVDRHLNQNYFHFEYDWRLDPYESAAQLDAYIDEIIEVTGHDKVILNAFSEGGEISLAYLDAYGSDKIEKYIAECSAFQGLTVIGKLFTKQSSIESEALVNYLATMLPTVGLDSSLTNLIVGLKYLGIYELVEAIAAIVLDNCFETIYYGFARNSFASMPGVFNFTPAEYYDDAIELLFGDDPKYAELIAKYDRYHNAQVNAGKILKACQDSGTAICLISNYGCDPMPFVGNERYQSDSLIDAKFTSGGATFAPVGQTLGESYVQKNADGHNHLSPDGCVDASTCMFPESTWFVSDFNHWNEHDDLVEWLKAYDGQPTVWDNPDYPQFLKGNAATGEMVPQK